MAGVHYIFIIQDLFSKLITLYPIIRATTNICLKKLKEKYFASPGWKASLAAEGVKVLF